MVISTLPVFSSSIEKACVNVPSAFSVPVAPVVFATVSSGVTAGGVTSAPEVPSSVPLPAPVSLSTKLSVPPDGVPPAVTVFGVVPLISVASKTTVKLTVIVSPGAIDPPEINAGLPSPSKDAFAVTPVEPVTALREGAIVTPDPSVPAAEGS